MVDDGAAGKVELKPETLLAHSIHIAAADDAIEQTLPGDRPQKAYLHGCRFRKFSVLSACSAFSGFGFACKSIFQLRVFLRDSASPR
jgi:hypothetical protein